MQLVNETPFEAALFRTALAEERTLAVLVAKASYVLDGAGRLLPDPRPIPVFRAPERFAGFEFEPDRILRKPAIDVVAIGHARPLGGRPTREMLAGFSVGELHACAAVFGERRWTKVAFGCRPSDPLPFESMPVSWANAYGGRSRRRGVPIEHPDNPRGKGYIAELDQVDPAEVPLPNVEDPAGLIRSPRDQPEPWALEPLAPTSPIRIKAALHEDDDATVPVSPAVFNFAHPRLRISSIEAGTVVRWYGWDVEPAPPVELHVPALGVEVRIDRRQYEFPIFVDALLLFPSERRICITMRSIFTYTYQRRVRRIARLVQSEDRSWACTQRC